MMEKKEAKSAFDSETFEKDGHFKIDRPIGSASISPSGRDVVLASRDGLDIIDLDNPYTAPRHLSHRTPWEVADVQWSPFASREHWIVSTSNQKALVWNVGFADSHASVEHVLHGHKRAITDINFSAHYPDILATCAVDSFVHCWDLRRPSKPVLTFCDWFAGATQVKWNRQEAHILASSHDKYLKIWDDRNGAQPLRTIAAHATKIYGVDWDRKDTRMLTTCSLDQTIKSWNYTTEDKEPTKTTETRFPVWRARYTPFGHGIMALPQRDDFDLHLYDRSATAVDPSASVHQFKGHADQVKEFLWRVRGDITDIDDTREFQLVSWGADQQLRLHRVNKDIVRKVNQLGPDESEEKPLNFTRKGAKYKTYQKQPKPAQDSDFGWDNPQPRASLRSGISRGLRPYATGYGSEGFMSAVNYDRTATKEMDPISWMRGVKIRKNPSPPSDSADTTDTLFSPESKPAMWDSFDSLGEEVSSVLAKFPKVGVEHVRSIDIKHRTLTLSLPGPTGKSRVNDHLKCRLDFPKSYPAEAGPQLTINDGESTESTLAVNTTNDSKQLSAAYLRKGRHSLEAVLRLLLGELTLEESIKLLEKPHDLAASTILADSSSSSDEDEDLLDKNNPSMNEDSSVERAISVDNTRYNVPRPNTCGAKFTEGGALIYFMLQKREEISLLGQSLGIGSQASITSKEIFEGFGRLHHSHRSKNMSPTFATSRSEDSDSESFELSSSESSTSAVDLYQVKSSFMPTAPWNGPDAGLPFGRDMTASQHSLADNAPTQLTSLSASKLNANISIVRLGKGDFSEEDLGKSYEFSTDFHAAEHNAGVAKNLGYDALERVWTLGSILLRPSEKLKIDAMGVNKAEPAELITIAGSNRQAIRESTDEDAMNSSVDEWVADQILRNLERTSDVQTLALFARALSASTTSSRNSQVTAADTISDNRISGVSDRIHSTSDGTEDGQIEPTESWRQDLSSLFAPPNAAIRHPMRMLTAERALSASNSPPDFRPLRANSISKMAQLSAFSASHEEDRGLRRTSSTLHSFAVPFTNAIQYSQSAAASPPNGLTKKKPSPAGSLLGAGQTNAAWMPSHWLSKASFGSDHSGSTISPPKQRSWPKGDREDTNEQQITLRLKLVNQSDFSSGGRPLLNCLETAKYQKWCRDYAEMLSAWGMPLKRAEIRKCEHGSRMPRPLNTKSLLTSSKPQPDCLVLRSRCKKCGHERRPGEKGHCDRCKARRNLVLCNYCRKYITGLSSPCLACGHTLHMTCRLDLEKQVITECVTGCGCRCAEQVVVEVAMPTLRQPSKNPSLAVPPARPKITRSVSSAQDDGAYHSLAKALDKRRESRGGLKATPSHIWRGG